MTGRSTMILLKRSPSGPRSERTHVQKSLRCSGHPIRGSYTLWDALRGGRTETSSQVGYSEEDRT